MTDEKTIPAVNVETIKSQAIAVITKPAEFFRTMPTTGGIKDPLIFLVTLSLVTGVIRAIFMMFTSIGAALGVLVITPILVAVFGFVGAAILFVIWKLMGSSHNYRISKGDMNSCRKSVLIHLFNVPCSPFSAQP